MTQFKPVSQQATPMRGRELFFADSKTWESFTQRIIRALGQRERSGCGHHSFISFYGKDVMMNSQKVINSDG